MIYSDDPQRDERAAFLLCERALLSDHLELITREVRVVAVDESASSSPTHISIPSAISTRIFKDADEKNLCVLIAHSHPASVQNFSKQDDLEEAEFFRSCFIRAPRGPHGSVVVWAKNGAVARFWDTDGLSYPVDKIRIVGRRLQIISRDTSRNLQAFDRQVRAFGREMQHMVSNLHVGVVGVGGIGSSVAEQLVRLGVQEISIWDPDVLDVTNLNRVLGSEISSSWEPKVHIAKKAATRIGLGTKVHMYEGKISLKENAEQLKKCDVVFGCTDDHFGRSILSRFAIWYFTPVFDTSALIDSEEGRILSIDGRVTTLAPGAACLRCRRRIDQRFVTAESQFDTDPKPLRILQKQGYAPELGEIAPAVITFTNSVASFAVSELLNRLSFYRGEAKADEIIIRFQDLEIRSNSIAGDPSCFCTDRTQFGRGDRPRYLGLSW